MKKISVERIKNIFSKKTIIKLAVVLGCLLVVFVIRLYMSSRINELHDQNAAARWTPEGGSAQISCFFRQDAGVTGDRTPELLYNLENALTEASIEEEGDEGVNINHCYSVTGTVSMTAGSKSATFPAIGCGGDFFTFHPVQLVSGSFFSDEMLMQDTVLLDETAAWQLFGGNNIAGQTVMISDVPHVIAGVIRNADGRIAEAAGLSGSMVYVSFDSMSRYGSGFSTSSTPLAESMSSSPGASSTATSAGGVSYSEASAPMQTLELLMPEPVQGFAKQLVSEKLGISSDQMIVTDNTKRFSYPELYKVALSFGTRSMQPAQTAYPYWENTARGWEDILALCFVVQAVFLAAAVILLTEMIVNGYRHKTWTAHGLYTSARNTVYDIQAARIAHKEKWKYF